MATYETAGPQGYLHIHMPMFGGKPYHPHDCDKCTYLGSVGMNPGEVDWYICVKEGKRTSVICRYGPDGGDYTSGPMEVGL